MMGGFGVGGFVWMTFFWVGVILLGVWAAGLLFPRTPQSPQPSAREILKARYARGEITQEHYHELLKELS